MLKFIMNFANEIDEKIKYHYSLKKVHSFTYRIQKRGQNEITLIVVVLCFIMKLLCGCFRQTAPDFNN